MTTTPPQRGTDPSQPCASQTPSVPAPRVDTSPVAQPASYASASPAVGDATGGIIPYKNVPALIAYYCGVFAILPVFPIGLTGLVLGIFGVRNYRRNPAVRGIVHAWIGIILGGLFGLLWLAGTAFLVAAFVRHNWRRLAP